MEIYATLQHELAVLQGKGYKCMILGDLNGHVGVPPLGIEGNHTRVNSNGELLPNFIGINDLTMINKDQNICQGTFTRITPNSGTTILDYVLVSANAKQDITEMIIDEERDVLSTSDHVLVTVKINLSGPIRMDNYFEPRIIMKHDRNKQLAKDIMDHYIESIDWESLNMDEKCVNLQTIIMDANSTAYGYSRQSESERPKSVLSSLERLRKRNAYIRGSRHLPTDRAYDLD